MDAGLVTFKGAASFIGNEVVEFQSFPSEGKSYFGGEGGGLHVEVGHGEVGVIFEGPVLFSGNTAKVSRRWFVAGATYTVEAC